MLLPSVALAWTYRAEMNDFPSIGGGFNCVNRTKGNGESVTDSTSPNPSKSLHMHLNEGVADGGEPASCSMSFGTTFQQYYFRYWFKYGPSYQFHPVVDKQWYTFVNGAQSDMPSIDVVARKKADGNVYLTSISAGAFGLSYRYANAGTPIFIQRNTWYKVDGVYNVGTPGASDGWYKLWLNDVLQHDYKGIPMLRAGDTGISAVGIIPVWGGVANIVAPAGMDQWYDDLIVSSEPISGAKDQLLYLEQKVPNPPVYIKIN